jgi:integrase/recombinase XerD
VALALTIDRVDLGAGVLVFETLKKAPGRHLSRGSGAPALLEALDLVHGIREVQSRRDKGRGIRLWPGSRMTGWRAVHAVMQDAGLNGPHASPKGLRHCFGVAAVSAGIPLNLVQKWLGHAQLTTTAIMPMPSAKRNKVSPLGCGDPKLVQLSSPGHNTRRTATRRDCRG